MISFSAVIGACDWPMALRLLEDCRRPDVVAYTLALSRASWAAALAILADLRHPDCGLPYAKAFYLVLKAHHPRPSEAPSYGGDLWRCVPRSKGVNGPLPGSPPANALRNGNMPLPCW